jgi:hypothetical protein
MARSPQLITIYWRDIPAQVNTKSRTDKHQILLKPRFQKAIDRAAMVAGITTASDYVGEWRREAVDVSGDLAVAAQAEADRIEAAFDAARLEELVHAGGFDTARTNDAASSPSPNETDPGATT